MIVVIYYLRLLNHKGDMENDRQPSRLMQKLRNIFLFSLACLSDLFVEKKPAASKAEKKWMRLVERWRIRIWNSKYERIASHMTTALYVMPEIVSRTGAALRLHTLTHSSTLYITLLAHKHTATKEVHLCYFIAFAFLFSCLLPLFQSFFLSVSPQQWPMATPSLMTAAVWHSLKVVY